MTGKELIAKCMKHEELPRAPWIPYTGIHIGSLKGYTATELLQSKEKLLECLLLSNELYAPDGQPVVFDLQVEAEVLGCELLWDDKAPPTVKVHPLEKNKDKTFSVPKKTEGRIPLIMSVMKEMKARVGDKTALYGLITGPFTLASHLRGTDIFMDMYDEPDYVHKLLAFCSDVSRAMADYYIEAGMDVIGAVDPLVSQISPDTFTEFLKEPYKKLFKHIREKNVASSFFVCGDATKNIEVMCQTDPDCISIDENINMIEAKKLTDKYNKVISGNINLTVALLLGTQQDCQRISIDRIKQMGKKNFILAPGCDMPYDTPKENLIGIAQAVQNPEATEKALENYKKADLNIKVELPDYANLKNPLIEVCTIDSVTCAACGYMKAAADKIKEHLKGKVQIDVVEHKITQPENIARIQKLGIANLPAMLLNGKLIYSSIIPNIKELEQKVMSVVK